MGRAELNQEISSCRSQIADLNSKIKELEKKIEEYEKLKTGFSNYEREFVSIKAGRKSRLDGGVENLELENRYSRNILTGFYDFIDGRLSGEEYIWVKSKIEGDIGKIENAINVAKAKIASYNLQISGLQSRISSCEQALRDLEEESKKKYE